MGRSKRSGKRKQARNKVHGSPWGANLAISVSELEDNVFWQNLKEMGDGFNFDYPHSAQVCRLSLALFDDLRGSHGLEERDRDLLTAAALLHDIGSHMKGGKHKVTKAQRRPKATKAHEHQHHHKRSQRIILKKGIPGLTRPEVVLVSCVARYHTKAMPHRTHDHYGWLDHDEKRRVRRMAAVLRIADSLDRRHASMVRDLRCKVSKNGKECTIWLFCKKHAFDWRPKHRTDLFRKEFGLRVRIQILFGIAVG